MKKSNLKFVIVLLLIFGFTKISLGNKYLKDGYDVNMNSEIKKDGKVICPIGTIGESKEITKTGNPLDLVVAYKEASNGQLDGTYMFVGNGIWEQEDEYTDLQKWVSREDSKISNNIRENNIPYNYNYEYVVKQKESEFILHIFVMVILLLLCIYLMTVFHKKIIIIAYIVVISLLVRGVVLYLTPIDNYNHIADYILGVSNKHISKEINIDKNKKILDDKFKNIKWSISKIVNDYIVKTSASLKLCNNNIEPNIITNEYDIKYFDHHNNFDYIDEIEGRKEKQQCFYSNDIYDFKVNDCFSNYFYDYDGISRKSIDYCEEFIKLYDNVKTSNNKYFDIFIDDISNKISFHNARDSELLLHYLTRIISSCYLDESDDYYDNDVISYFKDWYIDGDSRDIELPYGVVLEYRQWEFVKKDIKEILYTNERELDHDDTSPQVLVVYYKDSNGNIGGTATDITFIKTGENYEMFFDPVDILYEIKRPTVRLLVK